VNKRVSPAGLGTMRTDNPTFVVLLIGVIILVAALTFLPGPAARTDRPGPDRTPLLVEWLEMTLRKEFITSRDHRARADPGMRAALSARDHRDQPAAFPGNANGRRSTSAASLSARRSSARTSPLPVYQDGKAGAVEGRAGHDPRPALLPDAARPALCRLTNDAATSFANYGPNSTITEKAIAGQHRGLHPAQRQSMNPELTSSSDSWAGD